MPSTHSSLIFHIVFSTNVLGQEEHHRTRTFQEEYLAMLKKSGVAYDERYLW